MSKDTPLSVWNTAVYNDSVYSHSCYSCVLETLGICWLALLFFMQTGATALYIASQEGHLAIVILLLDRGADVDHPNKVCYNLANSTCHS